MSEETMNQEEMIKSLMARVEELEENAPGDNLCLGVMDGDYDKTMAAFIIALGAAAYDMQVDMFFTFWGLSALRDPKKRVKKDFLGKMFGAMLPKKASKLPLSKMQMLGMGPPMIQAVMKMHNAKSLDELMKDAGEFGIRIENLVTVIPWPEDKTADRDTLTFETLTLAPIDQRLIVTSMLTVEERAWLNAYHARVQETLSSHLDTATRAWLTTATEPI